MSKIVYLITSYILPDQVVRLIHTLRKLSPDSIIVVHHDQSKSTLLENDITRINNVYLIPNPIVNIEWGGFSQVEILLHSFTWIVTNISFNWLVLISGQDYPISNLKKFEAHIENSHFDGYFRYFPALGGGGNGWPQGEGKKRYYFKYISYPHFIYLYRIPIVLRNMITKILNLINKLEVLNIIIAAKQYKNKIGLKCNTTPFNDLFICYGGWDWFTLNKKCINKILSTAADNYLLLDYYKTTHIPSESFIHTILNNDRELNILNNPLRYVQWHGKNPSRPSIICSSDLDIVINSSMPFARKFDITIDANVLDLIDKYLGISN
jgi:hypothetical protein